MIIDAHAHLGRGEPGSTDLLQSGITPEMIVEPAREAGIDKTLVFQVTLSDYRAGNREIAEAVQRYPDDLIGFARLNPTIRGCDDVLREAADLDLVGLKLHHGCDNFSLDDPAVDRIVDLAGRLTMPVIFHSMNAVEPLERLARRHAGTNIIFGHFAGMWAWQEMRHCIALAEELPNVYLETAANLVGRMIGEAATRVPDRVMFGSDAPAIHPGAELAKIRYLHLPPDIESGVMGGNIARLIGLS